MSLTGSQCMRDDPQLLSRRLTKFLAEVPAKHLARRIGCDQRTAENIKRGHWPIARHWLGLVVAFGRDVTDAVFHPETAAERLAEEVGRLEEQLAERKAALGKVAGGAQSARARLAQAAARRSR